MPEEMVLLLAATSGFQDGSAITKSENKHNQKKFARNCQKLLG